MPVKPGSYWSNAQAATYQKAMRTPNPVRRTQLIRSIKRR